MATNNVTVASNEFDYRAIAAYHSYGNCGCYLLHGVHFNKLWGYGGGKKGEDHWPKTEEEYLRMKVELYQKLYNKLSEFNVCFAGCTPINKRVGIKQNSTVDFLIWCRDKTKSIVEFGKPFFNRVHMIDFEPSVLSSFTFIPEKLDYTRKDFENKTSPTFERMAQQGALKTFTVFTERTFDANNLPEIKVK